MDKNKRTRWGIERGNIDLHDRPSVKNSDGSVSTVRSSSFERDGKEVLLPTVGSLKEGTFGSKKSKDATILTNRQANKIADKTGKHLGKFRTPAQADQYAIALHKMQEKEYVKPKKAEKAKFLNPTSIK